MEIPRIGNFGVIHNVGVNLIGNHKEYLWRYPESVTLGAIHTVSEGVNLMGNHRDTYRDTPNL